MSKDINIFFKIIHLLIQNIYLDLLKIKKIVKKKELKKNLINQQKKFYMKQELK